MVVFKLGINPWRPNWQKLNEDKVEAYLVRAGLREPPARVSLDNGIKLVEILTSPVSEDMNRNIREVMSARNFSHLEHGYETTSGNTAVSVMSKMEAVVPALLSKVNVRQDPLGIADRLKIEA